MRWKRACVQEDAIKGVHWALEKCGIEESVDLSEATISEPDSLIVATTDHALVERILKGERLRIPKDAPEDTIVLKSLSENRLLVTGRCARALIYGLLELWKHADESAIELIESPSFDRRLYKHEPKRTEAKQPHMLKRGGWTETSDAFWVGLFRQMSEMRLNGLWFWGDIEFETQLIWNKEFPEARLLTKTEWQRRKKRFEFVLSTAAEYGIEVYINLRLGHCPEPFLEHHNILRRNVTSEGGEDSPIVRKYAASCVGQLLDTYPQLGGFWLYFESLPDAYGFLRDGAVRPMLKRKRPLKLFSRTWFLCHPDRLQEVAKLTRGSPVRLYLPHKHHADRYHAPNPHPRIRNWIKEAPDADVLMMTGPCHTTAGHGHIITSLWADKDYVQELLYKAHGMGVRNISFNTIGEQFDKPAADKVFSKTERMLTRFTKTHLAMAARYMWKVEARADAKEWEAYLKQAYDLRNGGEKPLLQLLTQTSRTPCLCTLQFFGNPPNFEHPYLATTASSIGDKPDECDQFCAFIPPRLKQVSGEYLRAIDHINGEKNGHAPLQTIDELNRAVAQSRKHLEAFLAKEPGFAKPRELKALVEMNSARAEYHAHSIRAQLALFSLFKCASLDTFQRKIENGLDSLRLAREAGRRYEKAFEMLYGRDQTGRAARYALKAQESGKAWARLQRIAAKQPGRFALFKKYMASLARYMEINNTVRLFNHTYSTDRYYRKAAKLLDAALQPLQGIEFHDGQSEAFIGEWVEYLESERAALELKEMTVERLASCNQKVKTSETLRPDNVFFAERSLLNAYLQFYGKGRPEPEFEDRVAFGLGYDDKRLVLSLAGESEMGDALTERWEFNRGVRNATFFIVANFNSKADCKGVIQVRATPFGEARRYRFTVQKRGALLKEPLFDSHGIKSKVTHLGGGKWKAEVSVPFSDLGATPEPGDVWTLNLYSRPTLTDRPPWIYDGVPEGLAWNTSYGSVTLGDPYRMGRIRFE